MKSRKKIIIIGGAVAFLAALAIVGINIVNGAGPRLQSVTATPLARMDLTNTVSVTGTVKSEDAVNVYSTLAYQVKTVNVEVGDTVSEGDVLCELDTADLEKQIKQQSATISNSQARANHSLAVAQNNLDTEKYNQEKNYDKVMQQAKSAVTSAESGVEVANLTLVGARAALTSARKAAREYRDGLDLIDLNDDEVYDELRLAVVQNQVAVGKAEIALEDAKKSLEDAKQALKTAEISQKETIVANESQVTTAELGANFSDQWLTIEDMKADLDKAVVKAPVSGTITAVFATEGASGQGLLFVIEDTGSLKIATKIKEYDIPTVVPGLYAKIKSDGTADDEYEGKVAKIAPTAIKSAAGATLETTDVQFETEVSVTPPTKLRIGMNARLEIVTEEKMGVLAVPFDVVTTNANGDEIVYVARTKDDGSVVAEAVVIESGMETDFYVEIISDAINEGDLIISTHEGLSDGTPVSVTNSDGTTANGNTAGGGQGGPGVRMRVGG